MIKTFKYQDKQYLTKGKNLFFKYLMTVPHPDMSGYLH